MLFRSGQRGGRLSGTAAEYIALNVDLVSELPDNTSFDEGACLGIPCMTAHRCVTIFGNDGEALQGKTVLVTGGAGAVGHYAVQWAKRFGATVIATVSSAAKAMHATAAGANFTINYKSEDVTARVREFTSGAGVHHIVDVDFGGNLATTLPLLRANGSIAYYATKGNATPILPAPDLMRKNLSIHAVLLNGAPHAARQRAQQDIVGSLEGGGQLAGRGRAEVRVALVAYGGLQLGAGVQVGFDVDVGGGAAQLLRLRDDVLREGGLAGRLRAVDLRDASARDAADAEGDVQ